MAMAGVILGAIALVVAAISLITTMMFVGAAVNVLSNM